MTGAAQRAVACKGWRWLPGMRLVQDATRALPRGPGDFKPAGGRLLKVYDTGALLTKHGCYASTATGWLLPDLEDAATIQCLLSLVRDAYADQDIVVAYDEDHGWWVVGAEGGAERAVGDDDVLALVAALEAAGGEE